MKEDEIPCPAVELRQVSKRLGQRVILDRIDLSISRGEILVLVGKSGSGKSTLLKIVSGIETPDSGRVRGFADCPSLRLSRRQRRLGPLRATGGQFRRPDPVISGQGHGRGFSFSYSLSMPRTER